jgi:DNA-binding response OmpR family regulator
LATTPAAICEIKLETCNKRKTVLCVDHQPLALIIRKILLEHAGYAVLTAESAQAGLDVFASEEVDVVILHYIVGEIDGSGVSAQMRRLKPDTPIIVLLSSGDKPVAALPGVDVFVSKLGSPNILLAKLAEVLHSRPSSVAKEQTKAKPAEAQRAHQAGHTR